MTWSFQIKNGDLSQSGPGGFAAVTGQNKLVQDLKHWFLEPRGSDPFHPEWGSTLDGGELSDGTVIASSIGGTFTSEDLLVIEAEIRRILNAYQLQQAQRLGSETILYGGKNTFALGEILRTVNDVKIRQLGDVAVADLQLTTANGGLLNFTQPVA